MFIFKKCCDIIFLIVFCTLLCRMQRLQ